MISIRLLPRPRRAWLTSFGCTVASVLLLLAILLSLHGESTAILFLMTSLALVSTISAYAWPQVWSMAYRAWNKLARHYSQFARLYLLGLCYMIISSISLAGPASAFSRKSVAGSGWIARHPSVRPSYNGLEHIQGGQGKHPGWVHSYVSWATTSRQLWTLTLLPFLIVLSLFEANDEKGISSSTYTLF